MADGRPMLNIAVRCLNKHLWHAHYEIANTFITFCATALSFHFVTAYQHVSELDVTRF